MIRHHHHHASTIRNHSHRVSAASLETEIEGLHRRIEYQSIKRIDHPSDGWIGSPRSISGSEGVTIIIMDNGRGSHPTLHNSEAATARFPQPSHTQSRLRAEPQHDPCAHHHHHGRSSSSSSSWALVAIIIIMGGPCARLLPSSEAEHEPRSEHQPARRGNGDEGKVIASVMHWLGGEGERSAAKPGRLLPSSSRPSGVPLHAHPRPSNNTHGGSHGGSTPGRTN
jgi:hypothetical protein